MAVTPLPGNHCIGTNDDGTPKIQLKCLKGIVDDANVYTCATWRKFRAACPKITQLCSGKSEAYVAAVTVCYQKLF